MVYFIYKTDEDKKLITEDFAKIDSLMYPDNSRLSKLYEIIRITSLSSINNKELLQKLEQETNGCYEDKNNIYFKLYNIKENDKEIDLLKTIIEFYPMLNASNRGEKYLEVFYPALNDRILNGLLNVEGKRNILDDITDFGLLTFSNGLSDKNQNDLIRGYLYDGYALEAKYDKELGKGSFERLRKSCFTLTCNYALARENVLESEFFYIINSFKKYYYQTIEKSNLPETEKKLLLFNYNLEYTKLVKKREEHQKKRMY